MSDKILFHINTDFKLTNGASFEDVCNCMQALTPVHLYIDENETLRGVDDVIQIHYGQCYLMGYDNGYILQEFDNQKRTIQVFSRDLADYLLSYASLVSTQESYEKVSSESSEIVESVESSEIVESVEEEYLDEDVIIFPKNIDFKDFQGAENTSFESVERFDKDQMMEALLQLYDQTDKKSEEIDTESSESTEFDNQVSDSYEIVESEVISYEVYEIVSYEVDEVVSEVDEVVSEVDEADKVVSDEVVSDEVDDYVEDYESSDSSEDENSSNEKEKIWFRLFSKKIEDEDCLEAVYINNKIFNQIEKNNDIDLRKTIELSFTAFLKKQGYSHPKISVIFYENIFAEVYIETFFPLSNYVINEIEEQAHLNLYSSSSKNEHVHSSGTNTHDEMIFFVLRSAETYVSLSNNLNKLQDDSDLQEDIYTDNVGLHNLPVDFVEKIMNVLDYLIYKNDKIRFMYDSSEFSVLNEGSGLFSVFDHELLFTMPHLEPSLYPDASNYSQLPIAQFHR